MSASLSARLRGLLDRFANADIGSTAADVAGHRVCASPSVLELWGTIFCGLGTQARRNNARREGITSDANHLTFLTTVTCRGAGLLLGLSAHELRKAMCRRLAEAGCSASQIATISGHATQEVSRYTKAADQRRMAIDAMQTIPAGNENKKRSEVANLKQPERLTKGQVIEKKRQ
jgi:hypothetical protein